MSLWSTIFKSDKWLEKVVQEYQAKPLLVGSDLHSHSRGTYMILHVFAAQERSHVHLWKLFTECLQEHTVTANAEVEFSSGITLNVQALLMNGLDRSVQLGSAEKVFISQEGNPKIEYSFYKAPRIHDLDPNNIFRDCRDWNWKLKLIAGGRLGTVVTVHYRMKVDALEGSDESFWKGLIHAAERRKK
ncbi:hypothetical protein N7540_011006 [Penicillium herquei]|nr:hypothetical protein N7540_011006 [Penicillium herquei]